MSRFIESIRFESGSYHLLPLHQQRIDRTFAAFFPGRQPHQITSLLPTLDFREKYKVRVVYDADAVHIDYLEYTPGEIRRLELVKANELDYAFKFEDRTEIIALTLQSTADDILMVKNGLITDASYANVIFWDGHTWWTPRLPLLAGVRRQELINSGTIQPTDIRIEDLGAFKKVALINAMLGVGELEVGEFNV
jgi:4-amino-4-deoxychorismate lyase